MNTDKELIRTAYRETVKLNNISRKQLKRLHQATDSQLDHWLYKPDRYPSFLQLYELFLYAQRCKMIVAPELGRLFRRCKNRAHDLCNSNEARIAKDKNLAATVKKRKRGLLFIFHGNHVGTKDLSERFDIHIEVIRSTIKRSNLYFEGADISGLDFSETKRGGARVFSAKKMRASQEYKFILNDEAVTANDLSDRFKISLWSIRKALKLSDLNFNGANISNVDFSAHRARIRVLKFRFKGDKVTLKELSKLLKLSIPTIRKRLTEQNKLFDGADISEVDFSPRKKGRPLPDIC